MNELLELNDVINFLKRNRIEIALILITLIVVSSYGINKFPILKDHGLYSYIGQEMLRGHAPYSTTPDLKGPMIYFFDAFFMKILFFLPQYLAIRIGMLFLITVSVVLYYKVLLEVTKDKLISVASSLILMGFTFFMEMSLLGDPKLLMLLFLFMSLYFLLKNAYLPSGIFASGCLLSWQPGGLVIFAPLIYISLKEITKKERVMMYGKTVGGFLLGIGLVIFYFITASSARDFFEFTFILPITFKSGVSGPSLSEVFNTLGYYCTEVLFLFLGGLGFLYALYRFLIEYKKSESFVEIFRERLNLVAFILPFLLFSIYLLRDYQTGDDLSILFPVISLSAAVMLKKGFERIRHLGDIQNKWFVPVAVIFVVCIYGFFPMIQPVYPENSVIRDAKEIKEEVDIENLPKELKNKYGYWGGFSIFLFHRKGEQLTIGHQMKLAEYIRNNTEKDEKVLSLGLPNILFLTNRRNINKYPHLQSNVFILHAKRRGNLQEIIKNATILKPKFILLKKYGFLEELNLTEFVEKKYRKIPESITTEEYLVYERVK